MKSLVMKEVKNIMKKYVKLFCFLLYGILLISSHVFAVNEDSEYASDDFIKADIDSIIFSHVYREQVGVGDIRVEHGFNGLNRFIYIVEGQRILDSIMKTANAKITINPIIDEKHCKDFSGTLDDLPKYFIGNYEVYQNNHLIKKERIVFSETHTQSLPGFFGQCALGRDNFSQLVIRDLKDSDEYKIIIDIKVHKKFKGVDLRIIERHLWGDDVDGVYFDIWSKVGNESSDIKEKQVEDE